MEQKTIIFYGMTGAGKGTQAKMLVDDLKARDTSRDTLYIETGDRFRSFMEMPFHTSHLVKEALSRGELLPEFLPIWLWSDILVRNFEGPQNLILDGLARRMGEAPILDGALKFYGRTKPQVVVLNIAKEVVIERLKQRERYDDTLEKVLPRLDWYQNNVIPTIGYFKERTDYYRVHDIDGSGTVEEVHEAVKKAVLAA